MILPGICEQINRLLQKCISFNFSTIKITCKFISDANFVLSNILHRDEGI